LIFSELAKKPNSKLEKNRRFTEYGFDQFSWLLEEEKTTGFSKHGWLRPAAF
jgi:hypothetical protein